MSESPVSAEAAAVTRQSRLVTRFGLYIVGFAVLLAFASFLIFAGLTPLLPTDDIVIGLFIANAVVILVLLALVAVEGWRLYAAWRAKVAGARLHARIVTLFSIVAALPAILMAIIGSVTLERSLNPAFMQDVRGFVGNTVEAARLFRESQCQSLLQESRLTAADLDRGKALYEADKTIFRDYFASRAKFLGFSAAAMMKSDGSVTERIETGASEGTEIVKPEASDFDDARKNEPLCLVLKEGRTFVALRPLPAFPDTFLYTARPVDPFTIEFARDANNLIALYSAFDSHRRNIQIAFATMYVAIAAIMLLSAVWLGLSFANRLEDEGMSHNEPRLIELKTGDIAVIQPDGYLRIVDRKKDMILVSGFNVYPNELEDVLATLSGVLQCAAIGVPDERSGEAIKLFVVAKPGVTLSKEQVMEHMRANVTGYKMPKAIEFRDSLPTTNVGKILRRELRDEELKKIAAKV